MGEGQAGLGPLTADKESAREGNAPNQKRYRVELKASAEKEFASLPKREQEKVRARIDALALDPRPPGSIKLAGSGESERYRIRSGVYRIIYDVFDDVLLVLLLRIGHRSQAYRALDRLK